MGRRTVSFPLFAALLLASVLLAGATATPTIGAGDKGVAAKERHQKRLAPIAGRLSKLGYTLIALADDGRAKVVALNDRTRFQLRPPAKRVTLHLRAPDGTYAGPVVLARAKHGKRVILGLRAGARLGLIKLKGGKGYAKLAHRPAKNWIDPALWSRGKNGVPIGNGRNVGLVRSRHAHGRSADPDLDGVPNPLDIDDDGDLVLDNYDTSTGVHSSRDAVQALATPHPVPFMSPTTLLPQGSTVMSSITANFDGGSSDQQIATYEQSTARIDILWGGVDPSSAELDCGSLIYCSKNGTGRYVPGPPGSQAPEQFPECCDPDHDGYGSLLDSGSTGANDFHGMHILSGATSDQERAGDVLIERATRDGAPVEVASTMGFVFATPPVLASYDDGQGDSGMLSYPRDDMGPIPVRAGPGGDVILKLRLWRAQRRAIGSEASQGRWMDVGNLDYTVLPTAGPTPNSTTSCPLGSYSDIDPSLAAQTASTGTQLPPPGGDHLKDLETDQPSDPANSFGYTLNLTSCATANGITLSTSTPTSVIFNAYAINPPQIGIASSNIFFQLQP
jgi:hypothetical protein